MAIYVNEVGYLIGHAKHANVTGADKFYMYDSNEKLVKSFESPEYNYEILSAENTACIDFSDIETEGSYYIKDNNGNRSCSFTISNWPYKELSLAALKMFYYQRCGCELTEKYAGIFKHKACHTGIVKYIHNDKLSFECSGGWHDAGDYGRYITAAAVAVSHLLYAFKINPQAFKDNTNIPESSNDTPDILNECRYELNWMLKMQTENGGVYHKCTSMYHAPFLMPEDDKLDFITTDVSSLATADFAAVCALASRVYKDFDREFSEKLKEAAIKAGNWLEANQGLIFNEPKECTTGGYGDLCDVDERLWAETELFRIDKDPKHINTINIYLDMNLNITSLGWMDVGGLAGLCVLIDDKIFPDMIYDHFKYAIIDEADKLKKITASNSFEVAMYSYNFKWGSNMVLLTNAMILSIAAKVTDCTDYDDSILFQLDYLLGRNAMDISYVTGFGEHAFKNPHNRPTATDGIDQAIPGYVSGGPNVNFCDEYALNNIPKDTAPMKCYIDHVESYSTNEITIYWNSPLVFILAYLKNLI